MSISQEREGPLPKLGFGTYRLTGVTGRLAVRKALETGYRHIDTARMYDNERDVGAALRESGVPRDDVFLTTKVWHEDLDPESVHRELDTSLRYLDVDVVDLALVHWPSDEHPIERALEALAERRDKGDIRHVGVSNFTPTQVERALDHAPIFCNQVEYHPYLSQRPVLEQARREEMAVVAHTPLARGRILDDPVVSKIARETGQSPAVVVLRWLVQQEGVAAIPSSSNEDHIESNLEVTSFELTTEQMEALSGLAKGERLVDPDFAPAWENPGRDDGTAAD